MTTATAESPLTILENLRTLLPEFGGMDGRVWALIDRGIVLAEDAEKECQHKLDLMERSWPEPRDGTTWLHCKACQKHVWTVPSELLA